MSQLKAVVLRSQATLSGEFQFRIAKLQPERAAKLEEQLTAGRLDAEAAGVFGPQMDLSQAMSGLDTRDFVVFDYPAHHAPELLH